MPQKKHLTGSKLSRTLVLNLKGENVDSTTRTLLRKLEDLERFRWNTENEIRAIRIALRLAGITPDLHPENHGPLSTKPDSRELEYMSTQPFQKSTIAEACQRVLADYKGRWMTKAQVEYLVARGGYAFTAKDSKNSVDVTLRRLAADGKCAVERAMGKRGNKYRWFSEEERKPKDVS